MEFVKDDEKVREKKTGEEGSLNSSSPTRKDPDTSNIQVSPVPDSKRSSMDSSPLTIKPTNQILESTKIEMGEVREENERLKTLLAKVVKDYKSLQTHFFDIVQHEQPSNSEEDTSKSMQIVDQDPDHLISLSLGTNSYIEQKKNKDSSSDQNKNCDQEGLTLGLDFKFEGSSTSNTNVSASNSVEEAKEEEAGEQWPPSKIQKSIVSGPDVDEASQQAHVKKTRVSVRARCETPTMHDGCQWRKYGQKIAKGNPCPRAYYRCTVAAACPVRKQVQRCAEDMSILITTYEGTHNHPLPMSATAMASTTSAAARMSTSGSTTSSSNPITSIPTLNSNPITNLNALNFNLSNPSSHSRPFYIPNPTISSTPSYPTITLDLTSPPQTNIQTSQFNRIFPSRYSTNFNFSSSESSPTLPITSWPSGSYLNYNKSSIGPTSSLGSLSQQSAYLERAHSIPSMGGGQNMLTDTIAKAITSDPSFQSALANAITSYVGGPNGPARNGSGLMLMQSPMNFVKSKSASTSPVENRENIN